MKKEYISPKTLVVALRATQLLSESLGKNYDPTKPMDGGNALSRRNGMDYDDEEEDDF
jgi:hypothetical protein